MPDGSETDEPLLPSVGAGDRLAMESCLERYEGLVWALAWGNGSTTKPRSAWAWATGASAQSSPATRKRRMGRLTSEKCARQPLRMAIPGG